MQTCPSCNNDFTGNYCNQCSEKVLLEKDFSIVNLFGQAIGFLTNFDSKFYQTFKLLFTKPGELSLNNVNGIRVPYMKPFQIFIIANILFFIFLPGLDIFYVPSQWFFVENYAGVNVLDMLAAAVEKTNYSKEKVTVLYDASASTYAKALIFCLIPFVSVIFLILNPLKKIAFGKHVIFGMHYFSFFLMFAVVWTGVGRFIVRTDNRWFYVGVISLVSLVYMIFAIKKFYQAGWWSSFFKGIFAFLLINTCIGFYRIAISVGVLSTIS